MLNDVVPTYVQRARDSYIKQLYYFYPRGSVRKPTISMIQDCSWYTRQMLIETYGYLSEYNISDIFLLINITLYHFQKIIYLFQKSIDIILIKILKNQEISTKNRYIIGLLSLMIERRLISKSKNKGDKEMNEFTLNEIVEKLESVFLNILYLKPEEQIVAPNTNHLNDIKLHLNEIMPNSCVDVLYTLNTDKQFFGIKVNPVLSAQDALTIVATDEKFKLSKYQVELDSKLFDLGLTEYEIVALLLHDIFSMIDSYEIIDEVRCLFDLHVLAQDDIISIRDSVNYSQLIIFALKDTLYKVSSILFKPDDESLVQNKMVLAADLTEALLSGREKVVSAEYGVGDSVRSPKTYILKWMFMIYKDMKHNSNLVRETLLDAKDFTASKLDKMEIDKTLSAVNRINAELVVEGVSLTKQLDQKGFGSLLEISLFKSLKQSGLKGIEDSYYEFALRIKNCDTEEDAMYILRGINTRLSILEDYIYNTPDLSETERKRWETLSNNYRQLREILSKKKIVNKKQYGLFFDYDALDSMD